MSGLKLAAGYRATGFVQWRLSDAGLRSMSHPRQRPASETLNISCLVRGRGFDMGTNVGKNPRSQTSGTRSIVPGGITRALHRIDRLSRRQRREVAAA